MLNTNFPAKTTEIGTNGKLTPELFQNAGIPVTSTPIVKDGLVRHQPILSKAEILRQGREALVQLSRGHDWASWKKVLPVLDIARTAAMAEAGTNRPQGRRYSEAFSKWVRDRPEFETLAKLDKGTRARFFECFANLAAIDDWRAGLPVEQQFKLNYPTTVLEHWKKRYGPTRRADALKSATKKAPEHKLTVVLRAMSDAELTKQLPTSLPFERFLQVLSPDWRAGIESRLRLHTETGEPFIKASEALRRALSLVKIAATPNITPVVATAYEREAIAALRGLNKILAGAGIDEVTIVHQAAKERRRAKQRRRRTACARCHL
jgi:hypothetical protein